MTDSLFTLDCVAFGVPFRLSAESRESLATMRQCAPFGTETCPAPDRAGKRFTLTGGRVASSYGLLMDNEIVTEDATLPMVLDRLASDLMTHVADCAEDRVFVHAGVVGWQGHAMILPGRSFAGKTTLVAELVRAGATYFSDEYAVLDERGYVYPYARDLQMREVGGAEQRSLSVAQMNGRAGIEALAVSHVVFAEYVNGGRWMPEPMSSGLAVLEMMRHAIPVRRTPARVMATLGRVIETASAVRSSRGEASETARLLLATMVECGASV